VLRADVVPEFGGDTQFTNHLLEMLFGPDGRESELIEGESFRSLPVFS
jgi:hypothetical protein